MNRKVTGRFCLVVVLSAIVTACSSGNDEMIALQDYVQSVVNRAPAPIKPLPEFIAYDAFTYSAVNLRGPFNVPIALNDSIRNRANVKVEPDNKRVKEFLEEFSISSLVMSGTMTQNNQIWALIRDENGGVNPVTIGHFLGKNHGRIVSTGLDHINIVEIVPDGDGGWIERAQVINIIAELP